MIKKIKAKLLSDNNLNELLKGSTITFVLRIVGMMISYSVVLFISNTYGAEGVGLYNMSIRILTSVGIVCALGFNISVLRYVGEFKVKDNQGAYLRKIFYYFFQLSLPFSVIVATSLYLFSYDIAVYVFENKDYAEAIRVISVVLPLFTLNLINVEFIRGLRILKISEYLRSVNTYLIILLVLVIAAFDFKLLNSVYALAIGIIVTFLISLFFIIYHLRAIPLSTKTVSFTRKEFVETSLPMMTITVSSFLLAFSGVFFLEYFSTTDIVGIYSICVMLAQLVSLALTVVNTISASKFSELFWSNKEYELKRVLRQSSKLIFWSSVILSFFLMIGSKFILNLFGEEFVSGQAVLIVLIFGQIINAITGSVGLFLNMVGQQKVLRTIVSLTAITVVLAYLIVVPRYGMLGASFVSVGGTAIINIISVIYVYKKLNYVTFYIPFLKLKND